MNIDWSKLDEGISEELKASAIEKKAWVPLLAGATAVATTGVPWLMSKIAPETHRRWSQNPDNLLYSGGTAANTAAKAVGGGFSGFNKLVDNIPKIVDNVGKVAPLAIGAMMLPSLMNKGQQGGGGGGTGQPVVVNNYMGPKPNALTPRAGVTSLNDPFNKIGELADKKADVITKALADAAKRRMANRVLDTVAAPQENQHELKAEELEVVTKYPEMAKLLEDEQNRAYLNRLLNH
jgi:hypothetical protein